MEKGGARRRKDGREGGRQRQRENLVMAGSWLTLPGSYCRAYLPDSLD